MKGKQVVRLLPTVSGREAAAIFGVCYKTFKKSLDLYLHRHLRFTNTNGGFAKRFVLVDVLTAAYPEASRHTIHMMAQAHLARFLDPRIEHLREMSRVSKARGRANLKGKKDEGV